MVDAPLAKRCPKDNQNIRTPARSQYPPNHINADSLIITIVHFLW
jgi:hypothetical protein